MWLAVWLLFSSFTFYVTFVQYALLRRAQLSLGLAENDLAPGFALLALLGIAGSLLAGRWIDCRRPGPSTLAGAAGALSAVLLACAGWGLLAGARWALIACFAPMGLSLGLLIVVLLALLTTTVPYERLGAAAGAAAAASYLTSSLFAGWGGSPEAIGALDAALIATNLGVAVWARRRAAGLGFRLPPGTTDDADRLAAAAIPAKAGVGEAAPVLSMLLRLAPLAVVVLVDTALFVLLSRAPGPRPILSGPTSWTIFGFAHVAAALAAGFLRRRVGWRGITYAALACLAALAAAYAVHRAGAADLAWLIVVAYGAVVGCYTVALFTVFADEAPRDRLGAGIAWGMTLIGWACSPAGLIFGTALL